MELALVPLLDFSPPKLSAASPDTMHICRSVLDLKEVDSLLQPDIIWENTQFQTQLSGATLMGMMGEARK